MHVRVQMCVVATGILTAVFVVMKGVLIVGLRHVLRKIGSLGFGWRMHLAQPLDEWP
jgi:hypothetical protein